MAVLSVRKYGDPILRKRAEPVKQVTPEIRRMVADMFETMYDEVGIGLAAPQVGANARLIVMDCARREDEAAAPQPIAMVNPEIAWASDETSVYEEGCLSIPEYYEEVERPDRVRFRYTTLAGETVEQDADGLMATCIQHEIDHLNGVLFIDHLSKLKRDRVVKRFQKAAKREAEGV